MTFARGDRSNGFSLIEVILVSAILLLVFSGLIAGVKLMLDLIGQSKAETGARSLALSRIEYLRSLNYEAIGTVGGIPAGAIPQHATTTLNGVQYDERVLVLYVDRPEDGLEASDENGVLEDSKRIKVEYSWTVKGQPRSLALISDVAPKGMETSAGGGTLIVKVFDAAVAPVGEATVHILNTSVATGTIDLTLETNSAGRAIIPGAPARAGYQITVTKNGYSTDGTYSVTAQNPNPNPPHVAVASSTISTMTFFIDRLSNLTLRSITDPVMHEFADPFDTTALVEASSNTAVSGGELRLAAGGSGYPMSGEAYSTTTAPSSFTAWRDFNWQGSAPAGTSFLVRLYSESGGTRTLVPDAALPGNSAGFASGPVGIASLSTTTYPRLALGATLASSDASSTPALADWRLSYVESEPPLPDTTFALSGGKTIGTAVPKYKSTATTDAQGSKTVSLEWDTYAIALDASETGHDIKEVRGTLPYALSPGQDAALTFVLTPHTPRSLRVTVTGTSSAPLAGAAVRLTGTGYDQTMETSAYGQSFFGNVPQAGGYTLSVTKSGYQTATDTVSVSGTETENVILNSL